MDIKIEDINTANFDDVILQLSNLTPDRNADIKKLAAGFYDTLVSRKVSDKSLKREVFPSYLMKVSTVTACRFVLWAHYNDRASMTDVANTINDIVGPEGERSVECSVKGFLGTMSLPFVQQRIECDYKN